MTVVDDRPPAVTGNPRAFRVLVRNALFRRVELAALRRYSDLGALDAEAGWNADAWAEALEPYFDEHADIGTGPDARGPAMLIIDRQRDHWSVRQIFDDPAGDHDWGISAVVDLDASDEAGTAVLRVTDVGQLEPPATRLRGSRQSTPSGPIPVRSSRPAPAGTRPVRHRLWVGPVLARKP